MRINQEYIDSLMEVFRTYLGYKNGKELPAIAQCFIKMGSERGVKIEVEYGVKRTGNSTVVGYWIKAPEKNKAIFQQDIYMEDNSEKNVNDAIGWMVRSLDELEKLS